MREAGYEKWGMGYDLRMGGFVDIMEMPCNSYLPFALLRKQSQEGREIYIDRTTWQIYVPNSPYPGTHKNIIFSFSAFSSSCASWRAFSIRQMDLLIGKRTGRGNNEGKSLLILVILKSLMSKVT